MGGEAEDVDGSVVDFEAAEERQVHREVVDQEEAQWVPVRNEDKSPIIARFGAQSLDEGNGSLLYLGGGLDGVANVGRIFDVLFEVGIAAELDDALSLPSSQPNLIDSGLGHDAEIVHASDSLGGLLGPSLWAGINRLNGNVPQGLGNSFDLSLSAGVELDGIAAKKPALLVPIGETVSNENQIETLLVFGHGKVFSFR